MPDSHVLLETLADFARNPTRRYSIIDVLHDLAERITDVLGLTGAGVSLIQDGRIRFVTSPSEAIAALERVQEQHQAGPCADAATSGEVVTVADLTDSDRARGWPGYVEHALQADIRSVAGIPMLADGEPIGAIDLYSTATREWTSEDVRAARILTDIATSYLVHASELEQQQRTSEQLQEALDSRIIIEQAKGMLAASQGISVDQAFKALRKHARDHNARIQDVAKAVVNLGLQV